MLRKMTLFAAAMVLAVTAWTSTAEAAGLCSCTFCRVAPTTTCQTPDGDTWTCADYSAAHC